MILDLKDALPIAFERFNAAVTLWNLQAAVIFALLAFVTGAQRALKSVQIRIALSGAYAGCAAINLLVLLQVEAQRRALDQFVLTHLVGSGLVETGLDRAMWAPTASATILMHGFADVAAIGAIWLIPTWTGRAGR